MCTFPFIISSSFLYLPERKAYAEPSRRVVRIPWPFSR
jgi:hypothetical protein